jgi:rSAM/selenodomain-associated transferase 1
MAADNYQVAEGLLVQFAKAPIAGEVKTRLLPALSAQQAMQLHKDLVRHTCHTLLDTRLAPVELWVSKAPQASFFRQLQGDKPFVIRQQFGEGLGQRLCHAGCESLENKQMVVIVGSDCPAITADYLRTAFDRLLSGKDAVLGPASDGGFVLLGLRCCTAGLFADVEWGAGTVLQQMLVNLDSLGWRYSLLDPLDDIDRPEDLAMLAKCQLKPG